MPVIFICLLSIDAIYCFRKDFVMHVGGSVWALDWCPRVDRNLDNCIKSEVFS